MKSFFKFVLVAVLLVTGMAISQKVSAQSLSTLKVVVVDQRGEPIVGATVTIKLLPNGEEKQATTNEDGLAEFKSLPPGDYNITAEALGYVKVTYFGFCILPGTIHTFQIMLPDYP